MILDENAIILKAINEKMTVTRTGSELYIVPSNKTERTDIEIEKTNG